MTTGSTICQKCGAPVAAGARFCMGCGADVSGAQGQVATHMLAPRSATQQMKHGLMQALRDATLGDYEILAELGAGGMATVFLAHDIHLDRKVAIKVMNPQLVVGDEMVERFKLEARTAAGLSHPNIIPIYAVKQQDELLYFVMKFVEGRPLDSIIKEEAPLPVPMVRQIVGKVAEALGYAHRKGVVHRDIKPANIMIDTEGLPIVTDFGIAKVADKHGLTMTGATIGTPTYMSPEQCNAQPITGASDQYSLGVMAYEMFTGRPLFDGESVMTIMFKHVHEEPPTLAELTPECPPELAQAIQRMLRKEPAERFPAMEDVVKAMRAAALDFDDPTRTKLIEYALAGENRTVLQRVSTPRSPLPSAAGGRGPRAATGPRTGTTMRPSQDPTEVMATGAAAAPRRRRGLVLGVAAVLVVGLGGGLAVLRPWERGASDPPVASGEEPAATAGDVAGAAPAPATGTEGTGPPTEPVGEPAQAEEPPAPRGAAEQVARVEIVTAPRTLGVGETARLALGVEDSNGRPVAGRPVQWRSSDAGVLQVESDGTIRAVGAGTATVGAAVDGRRDEVTITVTPEAVAAVRVTPPTATIEAGDTQSLAVSVTGERGGPLDRPVTWRSSDLAVARVSGEGVVTGGAPGEAIVTASAGGREAAARITVTPRAPTAAELRDQAAAVIHAYARALEASDVEQIETLYPMLPEDRARELRRNLAEMENLRVTLEVRDVQVRGEEANVSVSGEWRFRASGQNLSQAVNELFRLQRVEDRWVITAIQPLNR